MTEEVMLGTTTLAAEPASVGAARRFASRLLAGDVRTDVIVLLISEAATNSVQHSRSRDGGKFSVTLYDVGGTIRTEVLDEGGPDELTRHHPSALATSGRGLGLIEDLADRWGHSMDDDGGHLWFEVAAAEPSD